MENGPQITLTRVGDRTYSWTPRSKTSRLLTALTGLALMIAFASIAIGAILVGAAIVSLLIVAGLVRQIVRGWLSRRRNDVRPF